MTVDSTLSSAPAGSGQRWRERERWRAMAPYLLAVAVVVLVHLAVVISQQPPALQGLLQSTDDYMRLLRVSLLAETGGWYDSRIMRGSAPEGMVLHWTRPMDLVLLAGGWALTPLLGFKDGLLWWGILVSPLLYLAVVLALIWATQPILDRKARCLLILAVVAQAPLLTSSMVGHADHHMLLHLAFVLSIGWLLRSHLQPARFWPAFAAGAALGLGLWLTMEALILLAASLASLSWLWLLRGRQQARCNLWHALGLTLVIALAVVAESPPATILVAQYDKISIVHLAMAGIALAFWAMIHLAEGRVPLTWRLGHRLALAVLGAAGAVAIMGLAYPKFFGGPEVEVDPRLRSVVYDLISELRPLLPTDRVTAGEFLVFLGSALVAVPFFGWRLWCHRGSPGWPAWLHLGLCLLFFFPLALTMRRFALFTELLLAPPLAAVLSLVLARSEAIGPTLIRVVARSGAMLLLLVGPIYAEKLIVPAGAVSNGAWAPACALDQVVGPLSDPNGLGAMPQIIMAQFNHGPELLYRTPHSVVAVPYHRNSASLLDADAFFGAKDDKAAARIARARNVGLVLFCRNGPASGQASRHGEGTLAARLNDGQVPSWLEAVDLAGAPIGDYRIYRVRPAGAPGP